MFFVASLMNSLVNLGAKNEFTYHNKLCLSSTGEKKTSHPVLILSSWNKTRPEELKDVLLDILSIWLSQALFPGCYLKATRFLMVPKKPHPSSFTASSSWQWPLTMKSILTPLYNMFLEQACWGCQPNSSPSVLKRFSFEDTNFMHWDCWIICIFYIYLFFFLLLNRLSSNLVVLSMRLTCNLKPHLQFQFSQKGCMVL